MQQTPLRDQLLFLILAIGAVFAAVSALAMIAGLCVGLYAVLVG